MTRYRSRPVAWMLVGAMLLLLARADRLLAFVTTTAVIAELSQVAPPIGGTYRDPGFNAQAAHAEVIRRITSYYIENENYSRNGWWSANGTYVVTQNPTTFRGEARHATTGAVALTLPVNMLNVQASPVNDDLFYFITGSQLRQVVISTGANTLIRDFGGGGLGRMGSSVDWVDRTGRYFVVYYDGAARVYDQQTNTIYTGAITITIGGGWIGITPDASYVVIADSAVGGGGGLGVPRRSYAITHGTTTLSTTGTMFWSLCGHHGDLVSASNGSNYMVGFECHSDPGVWRVDITLNQEGRSAAQQRADNTELLPLEWSDNDGHIACAGVGDNRNTCWVSVESGTIGGGTRAYKNEIVRLNTVTLAIERYAHHRSDHLLNYYAQPRVQTSWNGLKVLWSTNGSGFSGGGPGLYALELPGGADRAAPTLSSISPTSTPVGGSAFTLTATGSAFHTASSITWDGSHRTTSFVSSTSLTATIPDSDLLTARTVNIAVVTPPPGGGVSATASFTVSALATNPVPILTSISPTAALLNSAAFVLTATGTSVVGSSTLQWNGVARPTTVVSSTEIRATISSSDLLTASVVPVTIFTPSPGGGTSASQNFVVNAPAPVLSTISPIRTTVGDPAFTMHATGLSFQSNSVVQFDGVERSTTYVTNTQLRAAILAADVATARHVTVAISTPGPGGGQSAPKTFIVDALAAQPILETLEPASHTAGGPAFRLLAHGTAFHTISVIRWEGSDRVTDYHSTTHLYSHIAAADILTVGNKRVTVFTPGGGESGPLTFIVNAPNIVPTISFIQPATVHVGSGAFILFVDGTGYTGSSTVRWNGANRTTVFVSQTRVTAAITATDVSSAGTASVTVNDNSGLSNAVTLTIASAGIGIYHATSIMRWNAVVGAEAYSVRCGTASGSYDLPQQIVYAPNTIIRIADVMQVAGTFYCVIRAANKFGQSEPTAEIRFTISGSSVIPGTPTGLQVTTP